MKLKKNTTLYEQFQNPIETSPKGALVHICMTPDIPVLVQTLEEKKTWKCETSFIVPYH